MEKFQIITVPDPVLKQVAQPVEKIDDDLRQQMEMMLATMYDAPGIGLAANQVGFLNRVFVMDTKWRDRDSGEVTDRKPICLVNPEIVWTSEEIGIMEEGCLSIPGQFADVERPASVRVKYVDFHGQPAELLAEGLESHCVQHELDHLNGVLFIDYLSKLKRDMMIRRVEKMKKQDVM